MAYHKLNISASPISQKEINSAYNVESNDFLIAAPIHSQCRISIVIPIRDEAENLAKTLGSFSHQIDLKGLPLDSNIFEIIILANNCRDNSAEIARRWQRETSLPHLHITEINLRDENANIGFARRLLMNEAHRRLKTNNFRGGIMMTTDGDTRVAPDWIAAALSEFENGADAVGGRILMDAAELEKLDEKTRVFYSLDEEYRLLAAEFESYLDFMPHDSFPRHHQHFNANFAVTTAAYEKAGGIPDVKFLEDVAFYNALLRIDANFRHSPKMRVYTSARNAGRAELGLSTQLTEWRIMGQKADVYFVESAESLEKRFTARRYLRMIRQKSHRINLPNEAEISPIAEILRVSAEWLREEIKKPTTCGILFERISGEQAAAGEWKLQNPLVAVETAIADLKNKLEILRRQNKTFNQTA